MTQPPTVVGINRTQDGSIAILSGRSAAYSVQKERFSRRKHHWGRLGDLPKHYLPHLPMLAGPIDLIVEGFSSDVEIENLNAYRSELEATLDFDQVVLVSHHVSHLYSAFYPSPFDQAAGMVIDAQGSRVRDFTETIQLPAGTTDDLVEVSSFYRCERGHVQCIAKQLWTGDWSRPVGLGCFYAMLTRALWPTGEGNEGKVMGLAPFGDPDADGLPDLEVRGHEVFIPEPWLRQLSQTDRYRYFSESTGSISEQASRASGQFQDCANLAAAGQRAFENAVLRLTAWLHEQTGLDDLVFAGGTALNCSANGRIIRESPFRRVFIPPSPHDGGTALGCAIYGLVDLLGQPCEFRWENDFLGPEPDPARIDAAVRHLPDELTVQRPDDLIAAMVELLADARSVGLHQGRSESGPRALGNRSIIADPRVPEMRDYINFEVKGREWFRPLAPLVLADHAERIFEVDRPAPFMQYAAQVRPEYRAQLPGITHVDDSARLQTVEPVNTPFLHRLLTAWYERTGSPVLINTSLNGPGDPLVETPEQAIDTLHRTGLHALVMPPYLIRKRDEPPVPGRTWSSPS